LLYRVVLVVLEHLRIFKSSLVVIKWVELTDNGWS